MQEDKTSKWLAAELRKQQEENPLPYELGAWEAFEAKRASRTRKKAAYWLSGVAAAVALLLVGGALWIAEETGEYGNPSGSEQLALQDKASETIALDNEPGVSGEETGELSVLGQNESRDSDRTLDSTPRSSKQTDTSTRSNMSSGVGKQSRTQPNIALAEPKRNELADSTESRQKEEALNRSSDVLIASNEKHGDATGAEVEKQQETQSKVVLPKDPQLSDEEIREMLETKSFARVAMGLTPGFGASQGSGQATVGTSLGLGVMVDMEVTGKLVMGSGLAVNYLNQSSESRSYNNQAGAFYASSAVTETNEISQVQVDIPLYVKYPITRNRAISVQAGFSNLITFNQGAEHESSYTRQVAVLDATNTNSFTLKNEAVSQSQDLSVPNQKFYPLATANLGVNIRVFESKKTSYEVMPFYNYPLQEFSGYGEKLGMFGASFKVNFGTIQKK